MALPETSAPTPAPDPRAEPLVDVGVVARLLGVPPSWVYDACSRNRIPHHYVGRYLRFRISELEAWLAEQAPRSGDG